MTALKIFSLEDTTEQNVTILHEGEHIIGRGVLNCNDKRISRKHALITVCTDLVTIKAIHINPCFFKSETGNSITIVPKDTSVVLNDGDQFALLANLFWFKIRVVKENDENTLLKNEDVDEASVNNGSIVAPKDDVVNSDIPTDVTNVASTSKRTCSTEDLTSQSKRQKTENILFKVKTEDVTESIDSDKLFTNLNTIIQEDYGNKNDKDKSQTIKDEIKDEGNGKKELVSDDDDEAENRNVVASNAVLCNTDDLKKEVLENEDHQGSSSSGNENIQKTEEENKNNDVPTNGNDNQDNPSCSNDKKKNTRRERCWYGASCYRKNPLHRVDYSHLGDDDYDSDPDDDRPFCPFGAACYRKNLEHRRQYKHANPPAAKPSKINLQVNVNSSCPFCSHCNSNRLHKPDYESDYESDYEY